MKLGTEVGLGPGHIVLDGDTAPPPKKGGHSPQFLAHVCCGQTAGWTKMPLSMEIDLGLGDIVLDGDPAPPERGPSSPPSLRPVSIVAKRSPISAAAEYLCDRCYICVASDGEGPAEASVRSSGEEDEFSRRARRPLQALESDAPGLGRRRRRQRPVRTARAPTQPPSLTGTGMSAECLV